MLRTSALACFALTLTACALSHELDAGGPDGSREGDAGTRRVDAALPDAGPECSIVGDFRATLDGTVAIFRFQDDGTWAAAPEGMDLSGIVGRYSTTGDRFRIYEPVAHAPAGCGPDDAGVYTMAFSEGCRSVRFTLVRDTCTERAVSLNGLQMTRVR